MQPTSDQPVPADDVNPPPDGPTVKRSRGNPKPARAGESLRYPRGTPLYREPVTPTDEIVPLTDAQIKARWRAAITANVSDSDMAFIVQRLVECAKRGEKWAMMELINRLAGKPLQAMEVADTTAERMMSESEARAVLGQFITEFEQSSPPDGETVEPEQPSNGSTVTPE